MAKEEKRNKEKQNKKGIKFQIQSKIGISVIVVMALVTVLVVAVVYSLLTDANNAELQKDSEAAGLEVENILHPLKEW